MSTLYDLLGVAPSATAAEIRDAWRSTIADLDPTDRRFGLLNDAAGVLLDADKRAAYDDSLVPAVAPEPVTPSAEPPVDAGLPAPGVPVGAQRRSSGLLLAGLAVLVAIVGAGALVLALLVPSNDELSEATSEAEATARRAVTAVFSYQYTQLDADHDRAAAYLTSRYREKVGSFDDLYELIRESAPAQKLKVETEFVASGVVRTGGADDGWFSGLLGDGADRVQILVFFDTVKTSAASTTPITFRNFATLTMQRVDGNWLVDGIDGPPALE